MSNGSWESGVSKSKVWWDFFEGTSVHDSSKSLLIFAKISLRETLGLEDLVKREK